MLFILNWVVSSGLFILVFSLVHSLFFLLFLVFTGYYLIGVDSFNDVLVHSFYYFNDEIPSEKDFENTMADYLTFEFNMMTHGRGYLFEEKGGSDGKAN